MVTRKRRRSVFMVTPPSGQSKLLWHFHRGHSYTDGRESLIRGDWVQEPEVHFAWSQFWQTWTELRGDVEDNRYFNRVFF